MKEARGKQNQNQNPASRQRDKITSDFASGNCKRRGSAARHAGCPASGAVSLTLKHEGEVKTFSDKQNLRELVINRTALQEILKEILQRKGKYVS